MTCYYKICTVGRMPDALGIEFGIPTLVNRASKPETGCKAVRHAPKYMDSELFSWHLPTWAKQRSRSSWHVSTACSVYFKVGQSPAVDSTACSRLHVRIVQIFSNQLQRADPILHLSPTMLCFPSSSTRVTGLYIAWVLRSPWKWK